MTRYRTSTRSTLAAESPHRRSAHGIEFALDSGFWRLRHHGNREGINISSVKPYVTPSLYKNIKDVIATLAETRAAGSASVIFDCFRGFVRIISEDGKLEINEIDAEHVARWVATGQTGTTLSHMRFVIDLWTKLRVKGLKREASELFERLINPPDPIQLAGVKSWDPAEGPYRPADDQAIRLALDDAFNRGQLSIYMYAMMRMFRGTGARSDQTAAMKVGDLRQNGDRWHLRIPQAKQRDLDWRGSFMPWKPVSQGFANILKLHIESEIRPRVGIHSSLEDCPLFPEPRAKILTNDLSAHIKPRTITQLYKEAMERIGAISPITGEVIRGTPRRDRHTYLTHLAMNGCTAEEIAANAGHTKIASCTPYVDASIDHFQRMERLVGAVFVPIADRFVGNVVEQEKDAHADDVILDNAAKGMGSCASGGCNAIETGAAPFACYSCRKFRAWADAPHADLLELLLAEQERRRDVGHDTIAETTTTTIIAISDLLERIRLEHRRD